MAKGKKGGAGFRFKGQRFPRRKNPLSGNTLGEYSGNSSASASRGFLRTHGYTLADEARNTAYNRHGAFGRDAKLRYKPVTFISAGFMDPLKDLDAQLTATDGPEAGMIAASESPVATEAPITGAHPLGGRNPSSPDKGHSARMPATGSSAGRADSEHSPGSKSEKGWDSSEEVILFRGRHRASGKPVSTDITQDERNVDSLKLSELDLELERVIKETVHQNTTRPDNVKKAKDYIPTDPKPRGGGKQRGFNHSNASDEEAAVIADYMANIREWGDDDDEDEEGQDDVGHVGIGPYTFNVLRDLGGTDSDANSNHVSSDDVTDNGSGDEADMEDCRGPQGVDDEQIARILAREEELGGNDMLLFDGAASDEEWVTRPEPTPRRKRKGDSKKAKFFQKKSQYPSATQMADAFDDLDLMDWHRPSLKNFKKGLPVFDVSDSELEDAMKATWQKDRLKKAERKKAREELRQQGQLGKDVNPNDLRAKYLGGMSLDDLANEFETFLLGSQEQLILPPFDNGTRRTIHAMANKFKIKSQSGGKGKDRHPVLYRTKATLPFDQVIFDTTFGRIKQTWFPRIDANAKLVNETRTLKRAEARSGKTRFKGPLTYRDGDIVGQHAAEIGVENKGRTMLEKMGWSKGMALGSEDNKGIMVPITHVVKKSKAGLGDV